MQGTWEGMSTQDVNGHLHGSDGKYREKAGSRPSGSLLAPEADDQAPVLKSPLVIDGVRVDVIMMEDAASDESDAAGAASPVPCAGDQLSLEGYSYTFTGGVWRGTCTKCGGSGLYDAPTPIKDANGRPFCLMCGGSGVLAGKFETVEAAGKAAAGRRRAAERTVNARESKRLASLARRDAAQEVYRQANPATVKLMEEAKDHGSITEFGDVIDPGWERAFHLTHDAELENYGPGDWFSEALSTAVDSAKAKEKSRVEAKHLDVQVGEKTRVVGRVERAIQVDDPFSYYGGKKMMVETVTGDGAHVMFSSSAGWVYGITKGQELTFDATVKKHDDYDGMPQTWVNRPKLAAD